MASTEEVRVKNEPICYSQSISQNKIEKKVKEEPIEMSEEVEVKTEEKFSATEEFNSNKSSIQTFSIAFLNEENEETK